MTTHTLNYKLRQYPGNQLFRCTTFFASTRIIPGDPSILMQGNLQLIDCVANGEFISILTVHMLRPESPRLRPTVEQFLQCRTRICFIHSGRYEVPDSKERDLLRSTVRFVYVTIDRALVTQ